MGVAGAEDEFVGVGIDEASAAMGATECAGLLQSGQIPPDGRNGNADLAGQFLQGSKFHPVKAVLNLLLARLWLHT